MDLVKLFVVALFGLFLLNPDIQYAAAVPAPATDDNGVHSNLLQNINPFFKISSNSDPFNLRKTMGDIGNFVENIFDRAKTVVEAPLKTIFQQDKQQPVGYADTAAKISPTTTTTTTTTPAPQDNRNFLSRIIGSFTKGDFGDMFNSFQAQPSSQKSASSQNRDFFGNIMGTLFGKKRPVQTTTTTTTTTTLAPQLNTEIGMAALIRNFRNLIDSGMSLIRTFLAKNQSFDLGSFIQHCMKAMGSMKAISDIFLQKDMTGGIGGIGEELKETMGSIKNITDIMSKPGDFGRMLALPGNLEAFIKHLMTLRDEVLFPLFNFGAEKSSLLSFNIPKEFVAVLESFTDMCNFILQILSPPGHVEATNDIHSLANHTAGLVNSLSHIEEMVEEQFPKIKFPVSLIKFPKYVQLLFANDTLDDKNILKVIEEILPNTSYTKLLADFANVINKAFPNMPAVQNVANLLKNSFVVNMLTNMMMSNHLLQFGPLKDSMLQVTGKVGNRLLKMDRNGLIVKFVQLMEDYSTTFEHILQLFRNIANQLKPDPKKGNPFGQMLTNIPNTLMNPEIGGMFLKVIYEINRLLPHNVLIRLIKGIFDKSSIPKSLKYLLTGGPIWDFIAFIWRNLLRIIKAITNNGFISKLKYWLTGGPIRDFIELLWQILFHKKNN